MMGDKRSREAAGEEDRGRPSDNMEDIVRRLDQLLQSMSDQGDAPQPNRVAQDGTADAARREYRERRERERVFGAAIPADPAWDILLDLFIARDEGRDVTVSSLSTATAAVEGTILRCLAHLAEAKLVARGPDSPNPTNNFLTLTDRAAAMMCDYFSRTAAAADAAGA